MYLGEAFTRTGSEPSPLVNLDSLAKSYCQGPEVIHAVKDVSLVLERGDFLTVTGRSGAGKTTLLSLIGGLTAPTSGSVRVLGRSLKDLDDASISSLRASKIGFVFQFGSLIPTLTTFENVLLPGLFSQRPIATDVARRLLHQLGVGDKVESYPSQLSGGQQARVALARALANEPELLLADEPTGHLDVETEAEILTFLQGVNLNGGTTIVLVTHNPELALYGSRHLIMERGSLRESQDFLGVRRASFA